MYKWGPKVLEVNLTMDVLISSNSHLHPLMSYGHREVTPLSSRTPRARQKKSIFSKLHHKNESKFYQFFFMSRYTQYLLHT